MNGNNSSWRIKCPLVTILENVLGGVCMQECVYCTRAHPRLCGSQRIDNRVCWSSSPTLIDAKSLVHQVSWQVAFWGFFPPLPHLSLPSHCRTAGISVASSGFYVGPGDLNADLASECFTRWVTCVFINKISLWKYPALVSQWTRTSRS